MISPLPGVAAAKPGSAMTPLPGISAKIVDDDGNQLQPGTDKGEHVTGYLVLDQPWPSMLRGIWGDPERYIETYWSRFADKGWYFAGDGARYDPDGAIWVLGRIDDVMNVSGHRISTAEVESALVGHSGVAEAAVVGATDETTGQAICAFVVLKADHAETHDERSSTSCATRWPRRSRRSPGRARSMWCPSCRRPAAARSCAGCCATSPRTASWVTRRRCWIPACSTRSGPASKSRERLSAGTGTNPAPGRFLALMSARSALNDMHHRRGVQRDVLDDAGRQVVAEGAVDHADQQVVDGHRRAGVARLAAHLHDDGARVLTRPPGDAARIAGGAALLAGDLAERRIRADAVDHEAVDVVDRCHLGRVELDHRVVEVVVARDHRAERAAVLGGLGGDLRARAAAVRGGEADQLARGVGADGRQRAQVSPLMTMPAPPPIGTRSSAARRAQADPAGPRARPPRTATQAADAPSAKRYSRRAGSDASRRGCASLASPMPAPVLVRHSRRPASNSSATVLDAGYRAV